MIVIAKYLHSVPLAMSQITINKDMKSHERFVLDGSDAKNALPSSILKKPWSELSGLSWILMDDDVQRTHTSNFYINTNLVN